MLTATVFAVASLSGCGGLGLPPAAPLSTPGASTLTPGTASPSTTPTAEPTTAPPTVGPTDQASPAGTTSPSEPTTPTDGATDTGDTVARMKGGNGTATPLLVPTSVLPSGWTATKARDTRGYRMTVCGVDLEPTEPVDGAQQNWQASIAGPYLEQHVRVYPDATATKVVAELAKKIPGCTTYTAKDGKGTSTFAVEKLALKGAPSGTVAWRQKVPLYVPVAGATPSAPPTLRRVEVVQDVAVRRVGAAVVLLNAYAVEKNPDDAVLVTALTHAG